MVVPKVKLNTGAEMPQLGLGLGLMGTWKGGEVTQVTQVVKDAINIGYRHIDCGGHFYQNDQNDLEVGAGAGLAAKFQDGTTFRAEVFITSKLWSMHSPTTPASVEPACQKTLAALGLDYLDLYLLHLPLKPKADPDVDYIDTWLAMEVLVAKGLCRAIGVSNFNQHQLERCIHEGSIVPAVHQVECHAHDSQELSEFCASKGIILTACRCSLELLEDPKLKKIAAKYKKTTAQVLVRYQIELGHVVIPECVTRSNIAENFNIWDFALTQKDVAAINGLNLRLPPFSVTHDDAHKQSSNSSSPGAPGNEVNETSVKSRKRKHAVIDSNDCNPKKLHLDVNNIKVEDVEIPSDFEDESRNDLSVELHNTSQTIKTQFPHRLIGLMYQLDLSILCSLRKSILDIEQKYPSLSLTFGDSEILKFTNIVLRYQNNSIHILIDNVDKYYIEDINYFKLFTKRKQSFSINYYFDSFVKYRITKSKLDSTSNNVKFLIIYTNSGLDLGEDKKLKQGRFKNFYPFKFNTLHFEECEILKDFLFTNDNVEGRCFYNFLQDSTTRKELVKRLEVSSASQKAINERTLSLKEIKEEFLEKLVFAVNQPNREELNRIVKNEIEDNATLQKVQYTTLQKEVVGNLTDPEKPGSYIFGLIYELNLLMFFLHDMFLHKNISFINSKRNDTFNDITIHYEEKIIYMSAHTADGNISYRKLFPLKNTDSPTFSMNNHFTLFVELQEDIEYFIIYTNAALDLTKERRLRNGRSTDFYPLQFESIDILREEYKFLTDCSCIDESGLYQFAQEETREKLLNLLKLPPSLQKAKDEGTFSVENEREIKETFLNKLIFAINQPDKEILKSIIIYEIDKTEPSILYNYDELYEIALRWSESHEFGSITKEVMNKIFEDLQNNRLTSENQKMQNKHINEQLEFTKSVVGREGGPAFYLFLDFLIKDEGIKYLDTLKRKGINQTILSSILSGAGHKSAQAFKELYDLWLDEEGNKTQYLTTLEKEGINLTNVSSILSRARANAASAFKELYDLWFDVGGHKTLYLRTLEEEGINLTNVCNIIGGSGGNAAKAFKDLYDLWFDDQGYKTLYLKTLEADGINLTNVSSILSGTGANAAKAFEDLYDLWFDAEGNKTQCLKTLEEEGINLTSMSSILGRARNNAAKAFKELYDLWFDEDGNKTQYLKTLEEQEITLTNFCSFLAGAGPNAAKAFKELYDLWFDVEGNKTQYLRSLEAEGITLGNMAGILGRARDNAARAFKGLYDLWFDAEGNKTRYLKTLEEEGISVGNISNILHGTGANAAKAFKDLYDHWFDVKGNKTKYLKILEENGISIGTMSNFMRGVGTNAPKAFKDIYNLWFDAKGNKTQYLTKLEENGIGIGSMSNILGEAGGKATKAFKDLYDLWFDAEGNKTKYLKTLEEKEIRICNVSSILGGAGANAAKAFRELYDFWFDGKGNKTKYLKTLEKNGMQMTSVSSILGASGSNSAKTFKALYDLWFDAKGNKTKYLKTLEAKGINLTNLSGILNGAGANAPKAFKNLYGFWFDAEGSYTGNNKVIKPFLK